jgi:hypothetical protein
VTTVAIIKTELYVEIQIDLSTYLLNHEQYAELWHTALQHPPAEVLWASYVTKEFIDPAHAEQAVDELNDFVANTCMEYAPEDEEDN